MNKFGIHLKTKDIQKSYFFYITLGSKPIFAYGSKEWQKQIKKDFKNTPTVDENYEGVTLEINESLFEIANGHLAVKAEVFKEDILSSKVSAMIDIASLDSIVSIANTNNFEIVKEPVTYPWGTKEVVLKDPDGFVLVFREKI